jgi:hypothetical protein
MVSISALALAATTAPMTSLVIITPQDRLKYCSFAYGVFAENAGTDIDKSIYIGSLAYQTYQRNSFQ